MFYTLQKPKPKLTLLAAALTACVVGCAPASQQAAAPTLRAPAGGPLPVMETRGVALTTCPLIAQRLKNARVQPQNLGDARWTPLRLEGLRASTGEALLTSRDLNDREHMIYTEVRCKQSGGEANVTLISKGNISPELIRRMNGKLFEALEMR